MLLLVTSRGYIALRPEENHSPGQEQKFTETDGLLRRRRESNFQLSGKSEVKNNRVRLAAAVTSPQAALSCTEISHQAQPMLAPAW